MSAHGKPIWILVIDNSGTPLPTHVYWVRSAAVRASATVRGTRVEEYIQRPRRRVRRKATK